MLFENVSLVRSLGLESMQAQCKAKSEKRRLAL